MKSLVFAVSLLASLIAAQDSCSLCPGSSQNYTADKPIYAFADLEIDFNVATCGDLAGLPLLYNSSDTCELLQAHSAWCECAGVTPTCTLCPNGTAPVDGDIMVPFENVTCDVLDYFVWVVSSASDCADNQALASFCGCPGVTLNDTCTLCPNGETAPNADAIYPGLGTCADIEALASAIPPGEICGELQVAGVLGCGCSLSNATASGNCTVCADGSSFPNPDKPVVVLDRSPPITITCGTFGSVLPTLDGAECTVASYLAATACGCTPDATLSITCPLCEDGSIAPRFFDDVHPTLTCYGLTAEFAFEDKGSQSCTAIQATGGVYCGCNNTLASQAATCRVCGDDMLLPNPGVIIADAAGSSSTCGELEYAANAGEIGCSDAQYYASVCCDSNMTVPSITPASASTPAPVGGSPTVSPASGPTGADPSSQPANQPTASTSGAIVLTVMDSVILTVLSIAFQLL